MLDHRGKASQIRLTRIQETYLFSAACSELNTEVKNNRRIAEEELRQQRTHLQHEVDILTQSLNQEIATLNDTVKGMYNDRKQAVREEQKAMDSAVSCFGRVGVDEQILICDRFKKSATRLVLTSHPTPRLTLKAYDGSSSGALFSASFSWLS